MFRKIIKIQLLSILFILLFSCSSEEISKDATIFVNDLPSGGPSLIIENDNLGKSIIKIEDWLTQENHRQKFLKSLSWLQVESETTILDVEGLTARELIEFTNQLKSKKK